MSMLDRMRSETYTPTPRWLYLLLKPAETLAGGIALANLTRLSQYVATLLVGIVYVALGLWAWYRARRVVISTAQGAFVGDFLYHGVLSAIALAIVTPVPLAARWLTVLALAALWWMLEVNNYGPMRAPASP